MDLKELFFRGLIVGPGESLEAFEQRVQQAHMQSSIHVAEIHVDWVNINYSRQGLRFWEGGCSWIGKNSVQIQLQPSLEHKKSLYKIYTKQELLQHEAIHAMRVTFSEPQFEEMLAYHTSKSRWRAFLGPVFRSPKESLFFVLLLIPLPFFPLLITPLLAISTALAGWRLRRAHCALKAAMAKLNQLTALSPFCWALALTDAEIWLFAKLPTSEIRLYIQHQKELRWEQLRRVFLEFSTATQIKI